MGNFEIQVKAVGGHGCQREVGDGDLIEPVCGNDRCPDCIARKFVDELQSTGTQVQSAKLVHWPDSDNSVTDDLVTGIRSGGFGS